MHRRIEWLLLEAPRGAASRLRLLGYRMLGLTAGARNRMERGRIRRCHQVVVGGHNAFTEGWWLWPMASAPDDAAIRIRIGDGNYFNRDLMIDACGLVQIGDGNMFGPGVYITDSNHRVGSGRSPKELPMDIGQVKIGNRCWVGAHAVILSGVELGDGCIVAAGAVVTRSVAAGETVAGVPAKPLRSAADA